MAPPARTQPHHHTPQKGQALHRHGRLTCEACGFDFAHTYGALGDGYIECHHLTPLSDSGNARAAIGDLALVCSNCHRMLHRNGPWPTLDQLTLLQQQQRPRGPDELRCRLKSSVAAPPPPDVTDPLFGTIATTDHSWSGDD